MEICILPLGLGETGFLEPLKGKIQNIFERTVRLLDSIPIWEGAYNKTRRQYNSSKLIRYLGNIIKTKSRVLAITDKDLYADGLNFVFGEADLYSGICIVSTTRLKNEFYGKKEDSEIFMERLTKEAVHELGHTFGLRHCSLTSCVMHFSNSIIDTDQKREFFCNECKKRIFE